MSLESETVACVVEVLLEVDAPDMLAVVDGVVDRSNCGSAVSAVSCDLCEVESVMRRLRMLADVAR